MSRDVSNHETAGKLACRTSWSLWNAQPTLDHTIPELWDLMKSWDSLGPADGKISLRYSSYWLEFDAARDWLVICDLIRKSARQSLRDLRIMLSFSLSAAAYSRSKYSVIVPFIIIFALDGRCRNLIYPQPVDSIYTPSNGVAPKFSHVVDLVSKSALVTYFVQARYKEDIARESALVAESIVRQWPRYQSVDIPEEWFDIIRCSQHIAEYAHSIFQNIRLREYVLQLQSIWKDRNYVDLPTHVLADVPYMSPTPFIINYSKPAPCSLVDVLVSRTDVPTPSQDRVPVFQNHKIIPPTRAAKNTPRRFGLASLEMLVEELRKSGQPLLKLYGNELSKSHRELLRANWPRFTQQAVPETEDLFLYHKECSDRKAKLFSEILGVLSPSQNVEDICHIAGLWPRITPRSILRQLARDRIGTLPDQWKIIIMRYAVSFIRYQQSLRLLVLSSRHECENLLHEIQAISDDVLEESPLDWLLIQVRLFKLSVEAVEKTHYHRSQIEGNFVVRPVQVAITRKMISPSSKRNISLQLNMGEGKSSVIIPLVTSTLANGLNLVRVVTLKPLSNQMFQILVSQLSGLANRPIFYVPISRNPHMNTSRVRTISDLYRQCVAKGGVLVIQPEHILSLKLLHIDALLRPCRNSKEDPIAENLGTLRDCLDRVSRDVLDESDEILHVRYQLIYTAGEQMPFDDHPNRWTTIQQVFGRLKELAVKLHAEFREMFEIDTTLGGFPIMRILDSSISQRISSLILDDALRGGLFGLPLGGLPLPIMAATRRFIALREVSDVDHGLVQSHCAGTTLFNGILLLRGLLMEGEGILCHVLRERRWKVDYGLDPSRTLLAVPYRAKVCGIIFTLEAS
jgi:hypothetical protein